MKICAMTFQKGQQITVTDYLGRRLEKVVWEDVGDAVLITSSDVLSRLERGDFTLIPIRFPKSSIRPNRETK